MLLIAMVLGSLALGFKDALLHSNDFQWSPSLLMWKGVNPYLAYLAGDRVNLILDQAPNYGHLLYVLLGPFAALPWDWAKPAWALTNLLMLAFCVKAFWDRLETDQQRRWWALAVVMMCIGYPVKITLGNGQQAILCLFALTLIMTQSHRPAWSGFGLALLMAKYSFGVPVAVALVILGRLPTVLVAAAWSVFGWLFLSFWTHSSPLDTLLLPVKVASQDVPVSFFDLLSEFRILEREHLSTVRVGGAVILGVNAAFFAFLGWKRRALLAHPHGETAAVAAASLMSLGTLYHLGYDLVVCLFWAGSMLLTSHRVHASFKLGLPLMFLAYWTLPRVAKFLPVNVLTQDWMVALLACGLIAAAFHTVLSVRSPEGD